MKKIVLAKNAPKPLGAYSQAVKADKFLFVSGQLGVDPETGKILSNKIEDQTQRAMKNIKAILEVESYNFNNVVQTNVYLSSLKQFNDFNCEYKKYFDNEPPARVTVGVELGFGALVEISMIAYKE